MKPLALLVLAGLLWWRDLGWLSRPSETLPVVLGLPLFWLLARPRFAPTPSQWGLVAAGVCGSVGIVLDLGVILALAYTLLVAALLEPSPRTRLHLPLVLLAFPWLILEGEAVSWWLRLGSAITTEGAFHLLRLPVTRSGTNIELPGVQLGVDAPCAGLHVLQTALLGGLALLLWDERLTRLRQLPLTLLALVGLACLAQIARLVTIGVLGMTLGAAAVRGPVHDQSGLLVLLLVLAPLARRKEKNPRCSSLLPSA